MPLFLPLSVRPDLPHSLILQNLNILIKHLFIFFKYLIINCLQKIQPHIKLKTFRMSILKKLSFLPMAKKKGPKQNVWDPGGLEAIR